MKVTGIIAEYNPFHNGHLYNIQMAKKLTSCDYVVCVLSSNFTQRGIPAIIDKWKRTEMALKSGVDLVIELPCLFSSQSAQYFSRAGVKILDSLNIVDNIFFGSEEGNIQGLNEIADVIYTEPDEYKSLLKDFITSGISFPRARSEAIKKFLNNENINSIISKPNNILGIEYIIALKKYNSKINPFTIKRLIAEHNSLELDVNISSASAIRKYLNEINTLNFDNTKLSMPKSSTDILIETFKNQYNPVTIKSFENLLLYKIRSENTDFLAKILDVSEGLENKIFKNTLAHHDLIKIIDSIKSKRYTYTRVQRIFTNILLNLTKDFYEPHKINGPEYIRVLGFNKGGQNILKNIRDNTKLPILMNLSDYRKFNNNKILMEQVEFEMKAWNIYSLALSEEFKTMTYEFSHPPVIC